MRSEKMRGYSKITTGIIFILLFVYTLAVCMPENIHADGNEAGIATAKKLIVGVPEDRCPLFYKDPYTGNITGIGVDLMRMAAKNAGYSVSFQSFHDMTVKDALDSRKYDLVMPFGTAVKSTAGSQSIISDSLFQTPFTLVTLLGRRMPGMSHTHVGMLRELKGVSESVKSLYPGIQIDFYENTGECVKELRAGKVNALLYNSYVWSYILQKPSYSDLRVQPAAAFSMNFCVGTLDTADGREIINKINEGINNIEETKKSAVILDYTSRKLYRYTFADIIYSNFSVIIMSVLIILIIVISFLIWGKQRNRYILSLEKANIKLEEANHRRTVFLSSMSHDMRTPLNGIIGFLNFAKDADSEEKRKEYIDKALTSSDIMLRLVNDVLDLSKIESSKMQLRPEIFDSRGLYQEVLDSVCPQVREHNIKLTANFSGGMPQYVYGDRLRLQQIALNLLSNAVKYTPDNGMVDFSLERVTPDKDGCNIIIRVKDTGIGMSEEFQKRMFEPFTQEHSSKAMGIQGTGLGLAIVKQIVDLMQGSISVNSKLDHGTEIEVRLPVKEADVKGCHIGTSVAAESAEDINILRGKNVLLVEDNELNTEIAATLLRERMKMQVECAADGKMAFDMFAAAENKHYDVILMDIRMPVMNGLDSTQAIRALERYDAKTIPIIAMTADSFAEDVNRCTNAGMNGYISKPINPEQLIKVLCQHLKLAM